MEANYIVTVPGVWSDKVEYTTLRETCLAHILQSHLFMLAKVEETAVCAIRTIQPNDLADIKIKRQSHTDQEE
ncbi:hypothetical protein N7532_010952 [Penicillium argentinense]|uniref:Uncharacterized protein n=1 Tax=Penicillium argentinense TaxID=1131581 RepID=A0A9W9EQP3_9EURO|nr:uncharacterized protein N7532_010952 [Penicillium argentinense]KAJ5086181.1 hypothetical protein N7532_010952 [Penicillium argentinense]